MKKPFAVKHLASFTLAELLITIGAVAILSAVTVFALNPAEMLKRGRDGKRVADIAALKASAEVLFWQSPAASRGTPSVVYISIPDTSSTCASLGLPQLPPGHSYHCATEADYRKTDGNGWFPLNLQSTAAISLSSLPIDPVNATSSGLYYRYTTDGTLYHMEAVVESNKYLSESASDDGTSPIAVEEGSKKSLLPGVFPQWYVKVPGNSAFGTSDFYVMQYEAKYDTDGDGFGNDANTCSVSPLDTWNWATSGSDCPSSWTGRNVVGSPHGSPIGSIYHDQAVAACAEQGAHLITNDEWMTIARNVEKIGANWTSGTVGTGYLFNGNSGDTVRGYNYGNSDKGLARNTRARLLLSNGMEIWDLAGNVREQVQRSTNNQGDATNQMALPPCSDGVAAWGFCNFSSAGSPYVTGWTADVQQNKVGPSNSSWGMEKGMGAIYTYKSGGSQSGATTFYRGGDSGYEDAAGVYALRLIWGPGNPGSNAGFRCAR